MKVGMLTVTLLLAAVLPRAGLSDAAHRTVEMTPVAAEGEFAKELGRYGMTAWRTMNRGPRGYRYMVTTVNYNSSGSL